MPAAINRRLGGNEIATGFWLEYISDRRSPPAESSLKRRLIQ
jgi:hypothetical protein